MSFLTDLFDKIFGRKKEVGLPTSAVDTSTKEYVDSLTSNATVEDIRKELGLSPLPPVIVTPVANTVVIDYGPIVDELLKRVDAKKLYPPFYRKLRLLLENCHKRGQQYYVTSCLRTVEEQDKLYAIGRTKVCDKCKAKGKNIIDCAPLGHHVTKVKGGSSYHNYAIAFDGCHDADMVKPGLQPDYTDKNYQIWAEEAQLLGLEAGYFWTGFKDTPHVQLPLKQHGITLKDVAKIYQQGGLDAVFAFLDQYQW